MSIGNHEHKSAEMVILSAVEGGLYVNYVSTSLNMTGAAYNLMFVIHSRYSFIKKNEKKMHPMVF
jgi:hypothetical protein